MRASRVGSLDDFRIGNRSVEGARLLVMDLSRRVARVVTSTDQQWSLSDERRHRWARLRSRTDRAGDIAVEVPAHAGYTGLVLAIVDYLDVDPEDILAAMGIALTAPVLRPRTEIEDALHRHRQQTPDTNPPVDPRADTLEWLLGRHPYRPGSGRPWAGGVPSPRQADGESTIADARHHRGDHNPARFATVRETLRWALILPGHPVPYGTDLAWWMWRRLRGRTDLPGPNVPKMGLYLRRGPQLRSWQIINHDGLLGTVEATGRWRRWTARDPDGHHISAHVHTHLADAAYELITDAFRAGRTTTDQNAVS